MSPGAHVRPAVPGQLVRVLQEVSRVRVWFAVVRRRRARVIENEWGSRARVCLCTAVKQLLGSPRARLRSLRVASAVPWLLPSARVIF